MTDPAPDFELGNVGAGPDPCSLSELADGTAFVVLLFQRGADSPPCREQVRAVAGRYDEFTEREAVVAAVLPEDRERAAEWQADYDLPFPLLADPEAVVSDAYDQPVKLGILGRLSDSLGRMPAAVVVDARGDAPAVAWLHVGESATDRPPVDDLLAELDRLRESTPVTADG